MVELNPKNERLKLAWIEDLKIEKATSTIDQKLAALSQFEAMTGAADFIAFDRDIVKTYLSKLRQTAISWKTKAAKVRHVRSFFDWMVMEENLKPKAVRKAIASLRLTDKEARAGSAHRTVKHPTLDQIESTIRAMPCDTAIERRNRALIAFTALSGARDGAIISLRLKHVRLAAREVEQHPDEVNTKASKLIQTWFFPVGDFIENEVVTYIAFLRDNLGFMDNDPLFPKPKMGHDESDQFSAVGLSKNQWTTAQPMRNIFRAAFTANDLRYYNPHSFRNTLWALAYERKLNPEALKAWSQNLGHENLDTSFNSYGRLDANTQRRAMMDLRDTKPAVPDLEAMIKGMIDKELGR